eukprot:13006451-Ditylum_brightwellii.AAC.1
MIEEEMNQVELVNLVVKSFKFQDNDSSNAKYPATCSIPIYTSNARKHDKSPTSNITNMPYLHNGHEHNENRGLNNQQEIHKYKYFWTMDHVDIDKGSAKIRLLVTKMKLYIGTVMVWGSNI